MYQVDRYVDVNTRGTALLLDILVNSKHNVEKVIVASSIGVYGEGAYECATHGAVAPMIRSEQQLGDARLGAALSVLLGARAIDSDTRRYFHAREGKA
jgi:dTDP-L-rhamnose 4-epimerase